MPQPVDPPTLTEVSEALARVSADLGRLEEDLLSCLVVTGEPDAQRTIDGWFDQVVDLLRAVDEVTCQHRATLARVTARRGRPESVEAPVLRR